MGKLKKCFLVIFTVMMLAIIMPVSVSASGTAPTKNTVNIVMGEFASPKIGWEVPKRWSNSFWVSNSSNSHSKLTDVKFYVKSGDSFTEMAYGSTGEFEADKVYKIRFTIAADSGYYYDVSTQKIKLTIDGNTDLYTVSSAGTTTVNGTEYTNKLYASYTFAKTPSGYIDYDIDVDYGEVTSENYYDVLGYSDGSKNYMVYDPDSDKLTLNKMVYDTDYYTNGIRVCPWSKYPQGTSSSEKIDRTILTVELIGDNRIYLSDTANFRFLNSSGGADFTGSGALTLRGIKTEKTSPNYYTVFDGNGAKLKFHDNVVITVIAAMEKNSDTANAQIRAIDNTTAIYLYDKARLDLRADNNVLDDDYIIRTGYLQCVTIKDNAVFSTEGFDLNGINYIEYPKTSIGYIGHNASDAVVFSSG